MGERRIPSVAVVDQDATNCMLLREICHASAWRVAGCATDVAEGAALLARTRPDCLITEYKFPGPVTGLQLIAHAKRLLPNVFTVMLTAWDINDVAAHVTAHQPDRILRKPVPPHVLMELLDSISGQIKVIRVKAVGASASDADQSVRGWSPI